MVLGAVAGGVYIGWPAFHEPRPWRGARRWHDDATRPGRSGSGVQLRAAQQVTRQSVFVEVAADVCGDLSGVAVGGRQARGGTGRRRRVLKRTPLPRLMTASPSTMGP